jgi:hypothetical protein
LKLLLAVCLCWSPAVLAGDTIVPHAAKYKIKISIASGTLKTVVRETDDGFAVNSVIRPTGLARLIARGTIEESSRFNVTEAGVRPMVYASSDTLSSDEKVMDFVFEYPLNRVVGTVNADSYEYPLDGEVHDRVSIQYQLMHNLLTGAADSDYAMLDGDELKKLQISKIETKRIKVPFGSFDAIGIRHQAEGSKRVTTLWCAEELGYLPVMIEQHRKGKRGVYAVLTNYQPGMPGERSISAAE